MAIKTLDDAQNYQNILDSARRTITIERDALITMEKELNDAFINAVLTIDEMKKNGKGRLIITGMGKSGHIGRKMAASFASTGTPSYFVHPGEASHGDLGMITEDDVVIGISNSGEAPELSDIIAYTRRFGIPLISITSKADSSLGKHSDICLLIPRAPEACPNGLAPTTSTTLTLVMGDALAVALLERMELTAEQYKVFHPGGKLGQKLLKISELMESGDDLPIVSATDMMDKALLVMTEKNLGCLIVTDKDGAVEGIVTDGDLKRHMNPQLLTRPVSDIMTANPQSIRSDKLAAEAVDFMTTRFKQPISCLVVIDDGKLKGLLTLQSCLRAGII